MFFLIKGFLLEQKLVNLLQPLEKNEKSMVKLDAIFKALGVETENDVRLLAQYFVNHRQYKELVKNKAYVKKANEEQTQNSVGGPFKSENTLNEETESASNIANVLDINNDDQVSNATVPADTVKLIHPNEAVTALKTFVTFHHKTEK